MKINSFKLERYFAEHEFKAPYFLCSSDGESFTLEELINLEPTSAEQFKKLWLGHTHPEGSPDLRREISKLYETIHWEEVLVHCGAEEAIFILMNVLLDKSDHVIVHYPRYQSLSEIATTIGCEVTFWKTCQEERWELDIDFLKKSIKKNTKMIVINCPHNPTGYLVKTQKYKEIIEIAKENGIFLFSDEVYRYLEYDASARLPPACDLYDNAISLGVMSKTFSLAGLRIGWIATKNRDILQKMAAFKDYTSRCNSAPSEFLSTLALRNLDKVVSRTLEIVHNNLILLNSFFQRNQELFHWIAPTAGSVAFPSLKINMDSQTFCQKLLQESGVLLMPGSCFSASEKHFRIGFGHKDMPECLIEFEKFLEKNRQELNSPCESA